MTKRKKPEDKQKAGRPSKYKPEYTQRLLDYFNVSAGDLVECENSKGDKQFVFKPSKLPTLAGFACEVETHRETLLNWADAHPEFFDALKRAKEHQERILIENGLLGGYDKTFAIFTAKNLINWRDKQELEHSGEVKHSVQFVVKDAD